MISSRLGQLNVSSPLRFNCFPTALASSSIIRRPIGWQQTNCPLLGDKIQAERPGQLPCIVGWQNCENNFYIFWIILNNFKVPQFNSHPSFFVFLTIFKWPKGNQPRGHGFLLCLISPTNLASESSAGRQHILTSFKLLAWQSMSIGHVIGLWS